MSEEQAVTQAAPEGVPASEDTALAAPETGIEQGTEQQAPEPAKAEEEPRKRTPWWEGRIDKLHARASAAEQRAAALEAQLQAFQRPAEGDADTQRPPTQYDIDRLVNERAQQVAAAEKFNAECNTAYEKGKEAFPDFEDALGNFRLLGGLAPEVVEAALATGEGHRVLYELGKDPDEAQRVLSLPPVRRAVELAKLALKPGAAPKAKPVSNAPAPVRPIDGAARVTDNPDAMTMEQFIAWREKNAKSA